MSKIAKLTKSDRARLLRIAAIVEGEAQTWREGFAVHRDGSWHWTPDYEWAHVRVCKLESAVAFLTELTNRPVVAHETDQSSLRRWMERAARELSEIQERRVENGETPSGPIYHILREFHALRR
jgi:hypothetical protein